MKDFISAILSAIKLWTKKEIKNSTADWNQNDSEVANYVKNRTHWVNEDGTVHFLDEKFIPDTIARIGDGAIKPFPYYAVEMLNSNFTQYKVNLEELEEGVLYSARWSASTPYTMCGLCVICEDGTEKIVVNVGKTSVYYVSKIKNTINLYDAFGNGYYNIDISDKSTSSSIAVSVDYVSKWLPTNNRMQYTPTGDYHPATKKYVDDSIADSIPIPTIAAVGQIVAVKAIDENGKPIEWAPVDLPSGGGGWGEWETVNVITTTLDDQVSEINVTTDADGNPFEYDELKISFQSLCGSAKSDCSIWVNRTGYDWTRKANMGSMLVANAQGQVTHLSEMLKDINGSWFAVAHSSRSTSFAMWSAEGTGKYTAFGFKAAEGIYINVKLTVQGRNRA